MQIMINDHVHNINLDIGETVYTTTMHETPAPCPACKGAGFVTDDDKTMNKDDYEQCKNCKGHGVIIERHYVPSEPMNVVGIDIQVMKNKIKTSISLKDSEGELHSRNISDVYKSLELVQKFCEKNNRIVKVMRLSDIVIPSCFRKTIPSKKKMIKHLGEYYRKGKFVNIIEVDETNTLIDGYTTYVLATGFGIEEVEVLVQIN